MLRSGFWLVILFLAASALNAWTLWLQLQFEARAPANYLYGEAILIELAVVVVTSLVFREIGRSHHDMRKDAAARIDMARIEGMQAVVQSQPAHPTPEVDQTHE